MVQISKIVFMGVVLCNAFVFPSIAQANDCNKTSPYFNEGDEKYYDLDLTKKLDEEEKRKLSSYFTEISGKWVGKLVHVECKGPVKNPVRMVKEAELTSQVKNNGNGVLAVTYDADYIEGKKSSLHKFTTLGDKNIFVLNFVNDNSVTFSEKYRRKNAADISLLVENVYEIKTKKGELEINFTAYHNGYFAWSDLLKLKER